MPWPTRTLAARPSNNRKGDPVSFVAPTDDRGVALLFSPTPEPQPEPTPEPDPSLNKKIKVKNAELSALIAELEDE